MILNLFRCIYWNLHVLLQSYTVDSEVAKTLGSSSLFGSATLFWLLSIYKMGAGLIINADPLMNVFHVGIVFVLSVSFSIFIAATTKDSINEDYVRLGPLGKNLSKFLSLVYVVGSFILFFGFILN